jgi:hypothetical protein
MRVDERYREIYGDWTKDGETDDVMNNYVVRVASLSLNYPLKRGKAARPA